MKVLKSIIGILLTLVPCLLCSYFIQYPFYNFDARKLPAYIALLLLALSGVAVILVYGGVALLNKHFKWYSVIDMARVVTLSGVIYFLIMILAFEKIPVPYSWIPSNNEMAFSFGQLLIVVFSGAPALLIAVGSMIFIIVKRKNSN